MSTLRTNHAIADLAGTGPADFTGQFGRRATVTYQQATPISYYEDSINVSSVTDQSTGNFSVAYTNSFSYSNKYLDGAVSGTTTLAASISQDTATTGSDDWFTEYNGGAASDEYNTVSAGGDLA